MRSGSSSDARRGTRAWYDHWGQVIESEGVLFTNWRQIMRRFGDGG